jgi:hypothetical protein
MVLSLHYMWTLNSVSLNVCIFSLCTWEAKGQNHHRWVSTSRPMSLASGFRHLGYGVGLGPLILVPRYCMLYSPAFWHLKYCIKMKKELPCRSILLVVTRNTPCTSTRRRRGYTLHVHTSGDWKGYTLHSYSAGGGKDMHPAQPHCMGQKRIHPHVRTTDDGKENTPMFTLLIVDRDTPSHPYC